METSRSKRYTLVAIALHWAIALAIVGNLGLGWWMHSAIDRADTQAAVVTAFQLHKSIGLTVLLLSLLRLAWRLWHPPPPLPDAMPRWQRRTAITTHWLFYVFMIAVPLSGWLYVSTQWRGDMPLNVPTLWFGWLPIPHLFGLDLASHGERQWLSAIFLVFHEALVMGTVALLLLHVSAALKHQFRDRDGLILRMLPVANSTAVSPPAASRRRAGRARPGLLPAAIVVALLGAALVWRQSVVELGGDAATAAPATALISSTGWQVDPSRSVLGYSGVHAGAPFAGRFGQWHATLHLDTGDVANSEIAGSIAVASASGGVPLHDSTLPGAEWFDAVNFPTAEYRALRIERREDGRYDIEGTLTIKGHVVEVLPLVLAIDGREARIEGQFSIDRAAIDMGMESDPDGNWVSREIVVNVRVFAHDGSR